MEGKLKVLAASLVFASVHAIAADVPVSRPDLMVRASMTQSLRDGERMRAQPRHRADETPPLAYNAFSSEEQMDEAPFARGTRLYRIADGEGGSDAATRSAPPARAEKEDAHAALGANRLSLPEPGNGAMILAGLLGVFAIARRRMSQ